jgi:DNA invertase Pin-like site-specific DNA recombinase
LKKVAKELKKAVAYLRTSSRTNVSKDEIDADNQLAAIDDKDSDKRQRLAIARYAKRAGYEIVEEYYDKAVKGSDPVADRPEFARMVAALLANGARTIIVESPDRFARDLIQQLLGHKLLADQGLTLIAASAPTHFLEDTPTAVMVRQILGSVSEFEKTTLVAKLKAARDRKRKATGKCGGRKSHLEKRPEVVALAKSLRRKKPKGGQMSLRTISAELAAQGHLNEHGKPFNPNSIASMLEGAAS